MAMDRREFLKIGGIAAAVGIGATVLDKVLPGSTEASGGGKAAMASSALRWGMAIEIAKLNEDIYQKCINACHSLHNVPDLGNAKDEIKWIWKTPFENAFPGTAHQFTSKEIEERPFLVLCNHCENPPCVRVCPTKATFKRKQDGIVMMDYHRCIGCRFCMAACPYGARSFNWRDPRPFIAKINPEFPTRERGVVEKCNFCAERIDEGKKPACVEASEGALVFGNLNDPGSDVRMALSQRFAMQRKPELGTNPSVYYIV